MLPVVRTRSDSSDRTAPRTKRTICCSAWRASTFGTNNIDHHRTADYTGLVTAIGDRAADSALTMAELYDARTVLLIGNDPSNQNPLVAWQIRSAIRHHNTKLFILNSRDVKLARKATRFVQVAPGGEAAAISWLATGEGMNVPVEPLSALRHSFGSRK